MASKQLSLAHYAACGAFLLRTLYFSDSGRACCKNIAARCPPTTSPQILAALNSDLCGFPSVVMSSVDPLHQLHGCYLASDVHTVATHFTRDYCGSEMAEFPPEPVNDSMPHPLMDVPLSYPMLLLCPMSSDIHMGTSRDSLMAVQHPKRLGAECLDRVVTMRVFAHWVPCFHYSRSQLWMPVTQQECHKQIHLLSAVIIINLELLGLLVCDAWVWRYCLRMAFPTDEALEQANQELDVCGLILDGLDTQNVAYLQVKTVIKCWRVSHHLLEWICSICGGMTLGNMWFGLYQPWLVNKKSNICLVV